MGERLLSAEEIGVLLGVSVKTLNNWYTFKRDFPDNEFAQMIPDCVQAGPRKARRWKREDVYKLAEFRNSIPRGRCGIMGGVTQKYVKKEKVNGESK